MWVLLILQGVLLLLVYRHFGLISLRTLEGVQRDGLPVGEVVSAVRVVTAQGETIDWVPKQGYSHLLTFVSPDCEPCARILPFINQLAAVNSDLEIALIVAGPQESVARLVDKFHLPSSVACFAEAGKGAFESYRVRVSPFAFVIGRDRRVLAKGLCDDPLKLARLLSVGGLEVPELVAVTARQPRSNLLKPEQDERRS